MTMLVPSLPIAQLEISRWRLPLRLTRGYEFGFQHGRVARVVLAKLVDQHELSPGLIPFSPESGRTRCAAGEGYTIGITAAGESRAVVATALDRLASSDRRRRRRLAAFGGLFELASDPEPLPSPDIAAEASVLASVDTIACQFVSPFRLKRPPELRVDGASFLNGDCWPWGTFSRHIVWRVMTCLGLTPSPEELARAGAWPGEVRPGHLLWCDLPDTRMTTEHQRHDPAVKKRTYTLGGVVGTVELHGLPMEANAWIALARLLHMGEHTSFGLGRFVIEALGGVAAEPFQSAEPLLRQALSPVVLNRAEEHLRPSWQRHGRHGARDGRLHAVAVDAADQVRRGTHEVLPLRRFFLRQRSGQFRPLSVPEWPDRVLQRAVHEALQPGIEALLSESSFAYRQGHSREGAAQAISRAWRDGYRWVLDGDVSAFFDSVAWDDVESRLCALLPFHADLRTLVMRWVRAPILDHGVVQERVSGLPVGMPLSPLLSNLLLDYFDRVITSHGFRLVRFADDFVILCQDREGAVTALRDAKSALATLHLAVHDGKTRITSFEEGFAFLGYRFGKDGSFAPLTPNETKRVGPTQREATKEQLEPSFAADPPVEHTIPSAALAPLLLTSPTATCDDRMPVYVLDPAAQVQADHDALRVVPRSGEPLHLPLRLVRHLVVNQAARVSLPCIARCAERGIPVFLVRRNGSLLASVLPQPSWDAVVAQVEFRRDMGRRVPLAQAMIAAKLHNAATLVVRHEWRNSARRAAALRRAEQRALTATALDTLRGHEGEGAALWFEGFVAEIPAEWGFRLRRKHPSPDPVNAMLSLGYMTLHHHAATALAAAGLMTSAGIFHEPHAGHEALASDLVEEFRFLVDALVARALHQQECTPADFVLDGNACYLRDEYRRTFLSRLEARLLEPAAGSAGRHSYRVLIDQQARQLREIFLGEHTVYDAVRLHG